MPTTLERLKLAGELWATRQALAATVDTKRTIIYRRKIAGLRDALLGRAAISLDNLDLFNPSITLPILNRYMDSLADAAPEDKGLAAEYLRVILKRMGGVAGWGDVADVLSRATEFERDGADKTRGPVFARFHDAGRESAYALAEKAKGMVEERKRLIAEIDARYGAEHKRLSDELNQIIAEIQERYSAVTKRLMHSDRDGLSDEEFEALKAERNSIAKEYETAQARFIEDKYNPALNAIKAERANLKTGLSEHGAVLILELLEQSPVSHATATAWANTQTITKAAANRLKKLGYDLEQVRRDMAEFYRLTGGRLAGITIDSSGDKRANATGVEDFKIGQVNLGSQFDKRVLFHELAHHMENDPAAKTASNGFLEKRRRSDKTVSLRRLTGNKRYDTNERVYEDDFFNPYVGKQYSNEVTEVFSMGIESFSDPEVLAARVAYDPEMFAMLLGYLKTTPHPLYATVKAINAQANDANTELQEAAANELEMALDRLAATVEIVDDGTGWMGDMDTYQMRMFMEYEGGKDIKYIGNYSHELLIYSSNAVRDWFSSRKKKGFAVARLYLNGSIGTFRFPNSSMRDLKAQIAVYRSTDQWHWDNVAERNLPKLKELAGMSGANI